VKYICQTCCDRNKIHFIGLAENKVGRKACYLCGDNEYDLHMLGDTEFMALCENYDGIGCKNDCDICDNFKEASGVWRSPDALGQIDVECVEMDDITHTIILDDNAQNMVDKLNACIDHRIVQITNHCVDHGLSKEQTMRFLLDDRYMQQCNKQIFDIKSQLGRQQAIIKMKENSHGRDK